jgi:hypothetical protein
VIPSAFLESRFNSSRLAIQRVCLRGLAAGFVREGVSLPDDHVGHDGRQRQPQTALHVDVFDENYVSRFFLPVRLQ